MHAGMLLSRFVSRLPTSHDASDIAEYLVGQFLAPFSALACFLAAERDGQLTVIGCHGYPAEIVHVGQQDALEDELPSCAAVREGIIRFDTMPEVVDRFPLLRQYLWAWPDKDAIEALATMPLRARGRVLGALSIATAHNTRWSTRDLAYLEALGSAVALWMAGKQPLVSHPGSPRSLTERQRQILTLVNEGISNPGIATRLGVSISTVKAEVSALLRSFDVSNRDALRLATEQSVTH